MNQQQDCLVITGKRKISAWPLSRYPSSSQNGIGLDLTMCNAAEVSVGDTVVIEKASPLGGESVILKPVEEPITGISARVTEYIPFAMKDNSLVIGEQFSYSF